MWKERGSEAIQQAIADEETARINGNHVQLWV
jgi:hypothetical protein